MGNFGWGLLTILVGTFFKLPHCLRIFCPPSLFMGIRPIPRSEGCFCLLLLASYLSLIGVSPNTSLIHRISSWWLPRQWTNTEVIVVVQARDGPSLEEDISRAHGNEWTARICTDMYYNERMYNTCLLCDYMLRKVARITTSCITKQGFL